MQEKVMTICARPR